MMPLHERAFLLLILSAVESFASCFVVVVGSRNCLCLVLLPGTAFSLPWSFYLEQPFPCLGPSTWNSFPLPWSFLLEVFPLLSLVLLVFVCLHSAILPGTVCLCWYSAILPGTPFYREQSFSVSAPGHSTWNSLSLSALGYSILCLSDSAILPWTVSLSVCTRPFYPDSLFFMCVLGHFSRNRLSLFNLHSAILPDTVFLFLSALGRSTRNTTLTKTAFLCPSVIGHSTRYSFLFLPALNHSIRNSLSPSLSLRGEVEGTVQILGECWVWPS